MCLVQWERRFLASQLKVEYSAEERDELFLKWNIYKDSKERKLQLVRQLWAANRQWVQALADSPLSLPIACCQ